jgi:hypothetical protein
MLFFPVEQQPMSTEDQPRPVDRIEIPGDTLVRDAEFLHEVLGGATSRTGKRLESEGLPFVMIAGRKYRPLNEGRRWLAERIQRKQPTKRRKPLRIK